MLQKTTPATILALLALTGGAQADNLIGDITWTAGSTVTLDDDTFVQGNLVIQEGVTVQIGAGFEFVIDGGGSITVLGAPDAPVLFTASGPERWGSITFAPGSVGSMEHAIIEKNRDAAVRVDGASPSFTDCVVRDVRSSLSASTDLTSPTPGEVVNGGTAYGFHLFNGADAVIERCRIHDIEGGRGVSRIFRVTQPQGSNGADGTSFNQNGGGGGPGANGLPAYHAGNGGMGVGVRIDSGATALVRDSEIFDIRGGDGGSGGKGGSGGRGGDGGDGAAFVSVGAGGNGGRGGNGVIGGDGGDGGDAAAVWAIEPGADLRIVQNIVRDVTGGNAGIGGVGGSGGQGGTGGNGASTSLLFVCGGDGGNGGNGGNAAPGGPSGDSGETWIFRVEDAPSRAFFVQNTVVRSRSGLTAARAAAGNRGPGGPRGLAGQPGPGGCDGSNGSPGSQGATAGSGSPGVLGATNALYSDSAAGIQIQAANNIFASPIASSATALFAQGGSIIATDSNCFDGWGDLNGGTGTGSLGFAFIVADPMFADPSSNDFRVMPGSPVIDAGDSGQAAPFSLAFDIAGQARIFDDPDTANTGVGFEPIDIGAHEFGPALPGCSVADVAEPFGTLNFFDVSTFVSLYNNQDPSADLADPIGVWNFFDISTFINEYNAGCP